MGNRGKMLRLQEDLGTAERSWGSRRRELELQEYTGDMREGYWSYWWTLGLWEDPEASGERW